MAKAEEAKSQDRKWKANPGLDDKKKRFTQAQLEARIATVVPGENHSTEDLIGVHEEVLEHLKAALRLAPAAQVREHAACGVFRQNRVHNERAWLINRNAIERLNGLTRGPPAQAWVPRE